MNSESRLILELWETVRDTIPAPKRTDVALNWLRSCEEYGFDSVDLGDLVGEDKNLEEAFNLLYDEEEDDDDQDYEYDNTFEE